MPYSRMIISPQPNEQWPQHQNPSTMEVVREREVVRAKIGEAHLNHESRGATVITVDLEGRENKSTRI